jgi:hypothetical protein
MNSTQMESKGKCTVRQRHPNAYTSPAGARRAAAVACSRSGAIQRTVPGFPTVVDIAPAAVPASPSEVSPKSARRAWWSPSTKMFAPLISPWTTF